MIQNKKRILAIDPGTRRIGVALLEDGKILYHGVKLTKKQKTPNATLQEAREAILRLITDLKPKIIICEKAFFSKNRNASLLRVLVDEIRAIAKRKGIHFQSFAPSTVKKHIAGNGRASKVEVAKVVVSKYPELKVFLTQDRAWKEKFHQNMFDAVALGMLMENLERKNKDSP
jgi:Holliday junction resolvasome RuvABC endonuclease subunit